MSLEVYSSLCAISMLLFVREESSDHKVQLSNFFIFFELLGYIKYYLVFTGRNIIYRQWHRFSFLYPISRVKFIIG